MTKQEIDENLQFKSRCLFGINDLNIPIYRVLPIHRLLQLLKDNQNSLVKLDMWDDPFEKCNF